MRDGAIAVLVVAVLLALAILGSSGDDFGAFVRFGR